MTSCLSRSSLLAGKAFIVTGASRGIGKAIVQSLAAHGAKGICIHHYGDACSNTEAEELKTHLRLSFGDHLKILLVSGDIAREETGRNIIEASKSAFGRIDCFISNAGVCQFMPFLSITNDLWHTTHQINLNGAFYALRAAALAMSEQDPDVDSGLRGNIIAISSISALVGGGEQAHYTSSKAGLKSLIESMSINLGQIGIRCNCVLPGTIKTAINEDDLSNLDKRRRMESRIPLGRLGEPRDVAGAVVFLASDLSAYMQGSSVLVDGGAFVNLQ